MNLEKALNHKIFPIISDSAKELGQETYVVGGFVRDFLLERENKKDIDFVTVGSGIELAKNVHSKAKNSSKLSVFKRFGDRKSTRLNSSHVKISYAVFCLKKKK